MAIRVTIEGNETEIEAGHNLLEAIRKAGISVTSPCGGKGRCGKCLIRIPRDAPVGKPTSIDIEFLEREDLEQGFRLACQTIPEGDLSLSVPEESRELTLELLLKHASIREIEKAALRAIDLSLGSADDLPDIVNVISKYAKKSGIAGIPPEEDLSHLIGCRKLRLWQDGDDIAAITSADGEMKLGIALDIGSTTMVAYAYDILQQRVISAEAMTNPQRQYGEDIMTRIDFAMKSAEQKELLERVLRKGVSSLLHNLVEKSGLSVSDVLRITFVGNTAMHHFFLGLDVTRLGRVPFQPDKSDALSVRGVDIGLQGLDRATVASPPLVAGYVGADHVAVLLATDLADSKQPTAAIDIGTNAEIALASNGRILCCSAAAGPAFEGGNISNGMRATDGAICRIWSEDCELKYETIGGGDPAGLCGSGLIDFVSECLRLGLIDSTGTFSPENCGGNLTGRQGNARYVLFSSGRREVSVTQGDIRQLQLAKAAMHAGLEILVDRAGLKTIDRLFLAGAFGANMSLRNGRFIGMLPEIPLSDITPVGNAAGTGAIQLLTDMNARERVQEIIAVTEHVELSSERSFQKRFVAALDFPHQDISRYPESSRLVKIRVNRGR